MNKELELEAEKLYPTNKKGSMWMPNKDEVTNGYRQEGFIAGATSKFVEKQKLEFAKSQLEKFRNKLGGYDFLSGLIRQELEIQIKELEQKLSEI